MHFLSQDEFYGAQSVTGPRHNLLLIRLSNSYQGEIVCETLPSIGNCTHEPLIEKSVISSVLEGCAEANARFSTQYAITHIRYVVNDTKPEAIYGLLTLKIIENMVNNGEFIKT